MSDGTAPLFVYPEPPDGPAPVGDPTKTDWLADKSRTYQDGWARGSIESLGRAVELCAEHGPRNHAAACALLEEGTRRFGDEFLAELKSRGVDAERFV